MVFPSTPPCGAHPSASGAARQTCGEQRRVAAPVARELGHEQGEQHRPRRRTARPPETTETVGLNAAATNPASTSPIRGPPATTVMWMPDSRPRRSSGTVSCRIVERNTAETTSAPPATARHKHATTIRSPASPNAAIAQPQTVDRDDDGETLAVDAVHPAGRERADERADRHRGEQEPDHLGARRGTGSRPGSGTAPGASRRSSRRGRRRRSTGAPGGP